MTEQEVVALMTGSKTEKAWDANCNTVKAAHGGSYPEFWFHAIMVSRVANEVFAQWETQKETTI